MNALKCRIFQGKIDLSVGGLGGQEKEFIVSVRY